VGRWLLGNRNHGANPANPKKLQYHPRLKIDSKVISVLP
jgi:hypothetical protein